jgi:8-oxo-dGTP diphosphatase
MWDGSAFSGTKIALFGQGDLVVYLRDDKAGIPWPNMWDLPGGGREADETPVECALREVEEEFGLRIDAGRVQKLTRYAATTAGGLDTWFCMAEVSAEEVEQIRFGDEGQHWRMMPVAEFLAHDNAVLHLKARLRDLLEEA